MTGIKVKVSEENNDPAKELQMKEKAKQKSGKLRKCRPGPLPGDLLDNGLAWIEVCDGKRRAKGNGIHLHVSR